MQHHEAVTMRTLVALILVLCFATVASAANVAVRIKPASPVPTVTPQSDLAPGQLGIPQPVATPECVADRATLHGDSAGCVYSCNSTTRTLIAGSGCVFATP
jgi:hypothetical protein